MAEAKAKATKPTDPMMELVNVRLFKDGDKYKDDVFVSVNDMTYQIKRGEDVKVPRCIAEVLRNSEDQDAITATMISELESEYKAKAEKFE